MTAKALLKRKHTDPKPSHLCLKVRFGCRTVRGRENGDPKSQVTLPLDPEVICAFVSSFSIPLTLVHCIGDSFKVCVNMMQPNQ